ncbi:MAG TPA: hypothetical protein VES40_14320, partial [Ilumatobacteraceae bacterium]|nr:hypothetical protein [Ilumatobacteraceae bacterium]
MRPDKRLLAIVIAIVASVLVVVPPAVSSPVLAQTPPASNLTTTKSAPASLLAGAPLSYTLSASNPGATATALFNLSFRDVLPLGVTYAGPTTPSSAGEPLIVVNQVPDTNPGAPVGTTIPQQTLIWSNVADLQAGDTVSITFAVTVNSTGTPARNDVHVIGSTITNTSQAYAGTNPRRLPDFDDVTGTPIVNAEVATASSGPAPTTFTAISVAKSSNNAPEGELLRGVHQHVARYSLAVNVTPLGDAGDITVTDLLPAQLEFLGCGQQDNSTSGPGGTPRPEYSGAPLLSATPAVTGCRAPNRVETVVNPVLGGVTYAGVYTLLQWILPDADVAAGGTITLPYAAGIPLFANAPFPLGSVPPTTGAQGSNLDNNTGPSTRETAAGEGSVLNRVRAEGNFEAVGLLEPGASAFVFDDDTLSRTIEDLRIRKEIVSPPLRVFTSGAEAQFRIIAETSEYVTASNVVLTDNIPNGLCPQGNVVYSAREPACAFNRNPSPGFASVVLAPQGGYTVVFQPIASIPVNGQATATYSAFMRGDYEGGPLDGKRTVSGDTFTNTVRANGTTTGRDEIRGPGFPAAVGDPLTGILDDSSATLTTNSLTLEKRLLPRNVSPRLNGASPAGIRCPDRATDLDDDPQTPTAPDAYIDASAVPTAAEAARLGFRLGDQICFRLRVDFDTSIRTRNPVVTDFLPPGTQYVAGSVRSTAANTVTYTLGTTPPPVAGPIDFLVGTVSNPGDANRYVDQNNQVFEVVFAVEVVQVPATARATLAGNLMKLRTENSLGQAQSFRDEANFAIVPPPPVRVQKGVQNVTTPAFTTALPNVDGVQVQQGSLATFRIDLENLGTAASFNAFSVQELDVLDVLPAQINCSLISNITNFGTNPSLGQCLNPGQSSIPAGFTNTLGRSVIRWDLPVGDPYALFPSTSPTGGPRTLTYTMQIPTPTSVSTVFTNDAGLRLYGGFTNLENVASSGYVPRNNIDPALNARANAPEARDPSSVFTPGAAVGKLVRSWISETNNNISLPPSTGSAIDGESAQAVVGEYVTFRYFVDIPAQTTVFGATLTDQLPGPAGTLVVVPVPPASSGAPPGAGR